MPKFATLYTRQGCHLCEEVHTMLLEEGFEVELVDIDADPLIRERYNHCIPVVEIDGKERFRGRIDLRLLRRVLNTKND